MSDPSQFKEALLDNQSIGHNMMTFRKLRSLKAMELAFHLGISEAAYTKYERGETKITVDLIKKYADYVQVDPIHILTIRPGQLIEYFDELEKRKVLMDGSQFDTLIEILRELKDSNDTLKSLIKEAIV
ncbi:helix-turn-helix domain-containing protein [Echinicola marina]|uniref:Helix-turn-helix protein n=1 Tax=Echinicola vietnamensis (strain DSM 17526 / LMG 23754 / KMM 6221) TaxID=926556 RepID=L0FV93_ECHVK|nr:MULTISPECIES: helix-turn-helix transcriptional regulator [Echinicola]AGA76676.1 Helix-turn-helix protein [Echinicola vietnamensis DSM 17526]UCS93817.1 helix-turn-helix domain-containing protein [Echinicola marina]